MDDIVLQANRQSSGLVNSGETGVALTIRATKTGPTLTVGRSGFPCGIDEKISRADLRIWLLFGN